MKNFKKILNKLALNNNKANADDFITEQAPRDFYNRPACCDALYFWRSTDSNVQRFIGLLDEVEDASPDPEVRRDRIRALRPKFYEIYIQSVKNFVYNYCSCNMQGGQPMVHYSEQMANFDCKTELNDLLKSKTNFQLLKEEISEQNIPELGGQFLDRHQAFIFPFADFAQFLTQVAVETLQTFGSATLSTKSVKSFLDDLCKIKNSFNTIGQYGQIFANFEARVPNEIYSVGEFEALIERMLLSINSASEAPLVSGEICLPVVDPETEASLNQYGVGSNILTACAVAAGLSGTALGVRAVCRIFRGANKARKTAAIAACVATSASQTGSAAVNANDPVLKSIIDNFLDKACVENGEGGLFQCEESTQGGGDGGGGPVDPPGGGEVGEMGGGTL